MKIDIADYERTIFSEKTTNRSITKYGWKVGEVLVVSHIAPSKYKWQYKDNEYRVYRSNDGLSAIDTTFIEPEDAIRFAEWLDKIYKDYFLLWTEYPHMPLFQVTSFTVKNGREYWAYLKELEKKRNVKWHKV